MESFFSVLIFNLKRRRFVFDEFYLKSPKGIEIIMNRSGVEVSSGKVNTKFSDVVLRETSSSNEIIVKKDGHRLVRLILSNARHLTLQIDSVGYLSSKTRGSVGNFIRQNYFIVETKESESAEVHFQNHSFRKKVKSSIKY